MERKMTGEQDLAIPGFSCQIPSTRLFTSFNLCSVNEGKKEAGNARTRAGFYPIVITTDKDLALGGLRVYGYDPNPGLCSCVHNLPTVCKAMVML